MPHTSEEQLKSEPTFEQAVVPTPEVLSFPHDILGKEYELNGVSFIVLGMQPVYYDDDEEKEELPHGIVVILNVQKQHTPVIPFKGGYVCITKICIGDEVIAGYVDIFKCVTAIIEQTPQGWMSNHALAMGLGTSQEKMKRIADSYRQSHPE